MAEIEIRREGRAGRITLNRPKALNALTYGMVLEIEKALLAWADDPAAALVVIDAAGERAFAAGGDIRDLYERGRAGDFSFGQRFWADEYRMNALIARFGKPVVTLVNGIVMGGGVGVASHASHRVVSERTVLAMPECGIGLIPDVGGSWLLGHAPGFSGEYLGLTGTRIGAADAILTGFADFAVPSARLEELTARLVETGDAGEVARFSVAAAEMEGAAVAPFLEEIRAGVDAAFSGETALDILAALERRTGKWAADAARALRRGCPLSVACALEVIRRAREMDRIEDALALEYRFSARCTEHGEFLEGIRAAVIDKDRAPRWALARLEDAGPERVAAMLAPLGERELKL
jgi:enoyl-CoA hydratase